MLLATLPDAPASWHLIAAVLDLVLALFASGHVVLSKRDTRAAIGWVGVIWLAPLLGTLAYIWLGINRVARRARSLRKRRRHPGSSLELRKCSADAFDRAVAPEGVNLAQLARLVKDLSRRPLLTGNLITPLVNGDAAYPAMLQAIDEARRSITLSTYIFVNDEAGTRFLESLRRAVARKVEVRVLIDAVGGRYCWRPMPRVLRQAGIPCARFLPTLIPWRFRYSNLRCHRKIMVVDGKIGFTGGMNIHGGNLVQEQPRHPIQDLHFRVVGPAVTSLQEAFADDWTFCTDELLQGPLWFPEVEPQGPVLARGIPNGPDGDFETLRLTLLGAITCARTSVLIVTPYFLPDASLIAALNIAAMRGVEVDIVLPEENDLRLVNWASMALLCQVLERGCRVWLSPPPFDHTKLLLVDNQWTLFGSGNWDPRSLRLNFEFNMECYDRELATHLADTVRIKMRRSHQLTLQEVNSRSLPIRLRDGVAGLLSPYL